MKTEYAKRQVRCPGLSGPRRKYGDISGEEFSVQARRDEGAYPLRSVTEEQRRLRRKGPPGMSLYLRLGLSRSVLSALCRCSFLCPYSPVGEPKWIRATKCHYVPL